jgi:hypothetical protein
VPKIRMDAAGWIAHVLWSEVDSKSNLDVGDHVVAPVSDVVDAIRGGDPTRCMQSPKSAWTRTAASRACEGAA